ncbi:OmpA family protein [Vibrio sp. PNB22_3_1]
MTNSLMNKEEHELLVGLKKSSLSLLVASAALAYSISSYAYDGGNEGLWFIKGSIGQVVHDIRKVELDDRLASVDVVAKTEKVDREKQAYSLGVGYFMSESWFVEGGYMSTEEVDIEVAADVSNAEKFHDHIDYVFPESGAGPYLQFGYEWNLNDNFSLTGTLGAFYWRSDYRDTRYVGGVVTSSDTREDVNVLYGLSLDYHATKEWIGSIGVQRIEFNRFPTTSASVGLSYRFGGSKPATVAIQDVDPPAPEIVASPMAVIPVNDADSDGVVDEYDDCVDSSPLYVVGTDGCAIETMIDKEVAAKVYFANDSSQVTPEYRFMLDDLASVLKRYPDEKIQLIGFASSPAASGYNLDLSIERAKSVRNYLIERHDIAVSRFVVDAIGEAKSADLGKREADYAQQRRVEITMNYKAVEYLEKF